MWQDNMTWEISTIVGVFALPIMTTLMTNKTLGKEKEEGQPKLFYFLKVLMFIFNLFVIGLGLWVAKEIAEPKNSQVADLLSVLWQGYPWVMSFIVFFIVFVIVFDTFRDLFGEAMKRR